MKITIFTVSILNLIKCGVKVAASYLVGKSTANAWVTTAMNQ